MKYLLTLQFVFIKWSFRFFVKKKFEIKVWYWSEMTRNVIKSDLQSSKMAAGSHFVNKKSKLRIDMKWREMRSKVIFGHPKWPLAAILYIKKKSCVLIWNGEKCDRKWFSVIQNCRRQPFCEKKIKVAYCSEMARSAIEIHFGHPIDHRFWIWPPGLITGSLVRTRSGASFVINFASLSPASAWPSLA